MKLRAICLAILVLCGWTTASQADDYPKKPIRIVVPFPAGAGPDQVARMLAQHFQNAWGQTVVVENRAGALGSIGAQEIARSDPDGYSLLMATNTSQAASVAMLKNVPYDPITDFTPIVRTVTTAMVLVVKPDFPAKDLTQFIDYARNHPNLTAGYGSGASQVSIGQLESRGKLQIVSASYRGVPQAITDVMGGVIDFSFADFSLAIPQIQGGTLRGIAITSPARNELTPDLPPLSDAMPGFNATIWYGLEGPAKLPAPIVEKIHDETVKFLNLPETRKKLEGVGVAVAPLAPAEFGTFIASEIERWKADTKAAGIEAK